MFVLCTHVLVYPSGKAARGGGETAQKIRSSLQRFLYIKTQDDNFGGKVYFIFKTIKLKNTKKAVTSG